MTYQHKSIKALGLSLLCASLMSVTAAQSAELIQRADGIPGRYIVVLHDETPAEVQGLDVRGRSLRRLNVANEMTNRQGGRAERVYERALNGFTANLTDAGARALLRDPRVRFIEQDAVVRIGQTTVPVTTQGSPTWGLDRIDQRNRPISNSYSYAYTGTGVHAYIIDTGILTSHGEFTGRIGNGATSIADGQGVNDCNGHGTHVAGTVGGNTYGVAKNVTLHPVRVLDCTGSGSISGVIAGVDWVTANKILPAVANMSLGGGVSSALDTAVRNSIASGVTYAIAAGNSNLDACGGSPSRVTEALVVGATDSSDIRATFSNFGTCVALFAPGVNITSAWNTGPTATNTISGTSMASPHVAGAVALVLQQLPNATPAQIRQNIIGAATPGLVASAGTGSPNRLLYSLNNAPVGDSPPVASFTQSCSGQTCTFTSTSTDVGGSITNLTWNFGDTTTGTGSPQVKTYASTGTFNVLLTVTDNANQSSSASAVVTVTGASPCTSACTSQSGTITVAGSSLVSSSFAVTARQLRGWLQGPTGANFDLALERLNSNRITWSTVATAATPGSNESITFNATSGTYRWRVTSRAGTGFFTVWTQ